MCGLIALALCSGFYTGSHVLGQLLSYGYGLGVLKKKKKIVDIVTMLD